MRIEAILKLKHGQVYYEYCKANPYVYHEVFVKERPKVMSGGWMEVFGRFRTIDVLTGEVLDRSDPEELDWICYSMDGLDIWTQVTRCRGQAIRWAKGG